MKIKSKAFLFFISFSASISVIAQPCSTLVFQELGFEYAQCRLFSYQSGNGLVYAAVSGGTPDYTYLWTNIQTGATSYNPTLGGLNPGAYEILVTDDAGCVIIDTVTVDSLNPISEFDVVSAQLDMNLEANSQALVLFVNQAENFANPNDPNADTSFFWNLNAPFSNWQISYDESETKDTVYALNGNYDACLITLNKNGCSDTLCKTIKIHGYTAQTQLKPEENFNVWYSNGTLTYFCSNSDFDGTILIYDVNGKLVHSENIKDENGSIIFDQSSGVYLYELRDSRGISLSGRKFIVE